MKIHNKTNYDTQSLRKLFIACEKHEGTNHKYRDITILNSKRGRIHGRAWLNSRYIEMYLSKYIEMYLSKKANAHTIAQVYIHEVGHNTGLHHKDMIELSSIDVSWLTDGIIPQKKPAPQKPKLNIIEVRANKAQAKLSEWTKKLNRAKTFVKKYQRKVKYYDKKMVASQNKS